ncbi:MAG: hypothetical protein AAGM67_03360, partial [Bacteroidota bacterium]
MGSGSSSNPFNTLKQAHDFLLSSPLGGATLFTVFVKGFHNLQEDPFVWTVPNVVFVGYGDNKFVNHDSEGQRHTFKVRMDPSLHRMTQQQMLFGMKNILMYDLEVDQSGVNDAGEMCYFQDCRFFGFKMLGSYLSQSESRLRGTKVSPSNYFDHCFCVERSCLLTYESVINGTLTLSDEQEGSRFFGFGGDGSGMFGQFDRTFFFQPIYIKKTQQNYSGSEASGYLFFGECKFRFEAEVMVSGQDSSNATVIVYGRIPKVFYEGVPFEYSQVHDASTLLFAKGEGGVYLYESSPASQEDPVDFSRVWIAGENDDQWHRLLLNEEIIVQDLPDRVELTSSCDIEGGGEDGTVSKNAVLETMSLYLESQDDRMSALGGFSGGDFAKNPQVLLETTDGKAQISSLDDHNLVEVFRNGADFRSKTVYQRYFMSKGEVKVLTNMPTGAVFTSTKGIYG